MKKKVLLSSIVTIAICLCMIAGSTYALFTDTAKTDITVTAGTVDIEAALANLQTKSLEQAAFDNDGNFTNGGTATLNNDGTVTLDLLTPGDEVKFDVNVANKSNVSVKYKVNITSELAQDQDGNDLVDLFPALVCQLNVNGTAYNLGDYIELPATDTEETVSVTVSFPNGTADHDNQFQGAGCKLIVTIEAVQANGAN